MKKLKERIEDGSCMVYLFYAGCIAAVLLIVWAGLR